MANTMQIHELPISKEQLEDFRRTCIKKIIAEAAEKLNAKFSGLCKEFGTKFENGQWVLMTRTVGEDVIWEVYYIHAIAGVMPNMDKYSFGGQHGGTSYSENSLDFAGFSGDLPTEHEAKACFFEGSTYFKNGDYIRMQGNNYPGLNYKRKNEIWFLWTTDNYHSYKQGSQGTSYSTILHIPIYRFNEINSEKLPVSQAILYWIKNGLQPFEEEFENKDGRDTFKELQQIYQAYGEYLAANENGISLDEGKVFHAVMQKETFDFLPDMRELLETDTIDGDKEYIKKLEMDLLECDYHRAGITRYGINLLYGPNEGHWDLWPEDDAESEGKVKLEKSFTARNPASVLSSGIVGIDFGTKSTVVVCGYDNHQTVPLRIGSGDYDRSKKEKDYENPTVMRFIDFNSFLNAYKVREGRPATRWNDLTVSYTAFNAMKDSDSKNYYSFFDDLKHWCGTPGEKKKITDGKGNEWNLPTFMELKATDPNPVELYAYYIGLYINNMIRGEIMKEYVMSFPVTFDEKVREKIRESFEQGIKKSLPTALLHNNEAMEDFRVEQGASEPAAYAVTALKEYNFDPEGEEENYYAVFDFGGGTTDFDFGVFKESSRQRFDYELQHFGANGDKTLGGENLLRLLAFKVFRDNVEKLMDPSVSLKDRKAQDSPKEETPMNPPAPPKDGEAQNPPQEESQKEKQRGVIPFTYAAEPERFPEAIRLINKTSQEAQKNMHSLMQALRPVWESPDSEEAKKIVGNDLALTLYDETGEAITNIKLNIGPSPKVAQPEIRQEADKRDDLVTLHGLASIEKPEERILTDVHGVPIRVRYKPATILENAGYGSKRMTLDDWEKLKAWIAGLLGSFNGVLDKFDGYIISCVRAQHMLDKFSEEESDPPEPPQASPLGPTPVEYLQGILRERIEKGVENFFHAMKQAFDAAPRSSIKPLTAAGNIAIFLAGNSSKSKLVREIFNDYIGEKKKAAALLGIEASEVNFTLFPPLGTPEAEALQETRGKKPGGDAFARPNGKTGVAFGLISCRDGGEIDVHDIQPDEESEESFQYYIGRAKKGRFITVIDRNTKMRKWYEFLDDAGETFEILYSTAPEAATNKAPVSISKIYRVHLEKADPESRIFIRPVSSHSIEYAVAESIEEADNATPVIIDFSKKGEHDYGNLR